MKLNYYQRILLLVLSPIFVAGLLFSSINAAREQKAIKDKIIEEKIILAEFLATTVEIAQTKTAVAFHQQLVEELAEAEDVFYIRIVKPDGEICQASNRAEIGKYINNSAVFAKTTLVKDDVYENEIIKTIVVPLTGYTIWYGFSLKSANAALGRTFLINAAITLLVLALIVIFALFFSKNIVSPIKKLIKGVNLIRQGNLSYKININRKDEIGELADSFNQMTEDLKISQDKLRNNSENLEKLIKTRTWELDKKIIELEKFQKLAVGRELKMIELKEKISKLKIKAEN